VVVSAQSGAGDWRGRRIASRTWSAATRRAIESSHVRADARASNLASAPIARR
jgi:hypothetical protein